MRLEYAAHVGHPISHTASAFTIGLAITGAVVAGVVAVGTGGGVIAVIGAFSTTGSLGLNVGRVIDSFRPRDLSGQVASGAPGVLLGPGMKPAARAMSEDTKVRCHNRMVGEGSKSVMIGREAKPMSRRQDRTRCNGILAGGVDSIIVGGEPSAAGTTFAEEDPLIVTVLSALFDILGAGKTLTEGGFRRTAQATLQASAVGLSLAGQDEAARIVKAVGMTRPQGLREAADGAFTASQGGGAVVSLFGRPATAPGIAPGP